MKKLSIVWTMLVAVVLLASCGKKDAANLIPEDALWVMRLDVAKMQEQMGMNDDKSDFKDQVKEIIDEMGLDKELREKVLDIIDDPTASGIDFTEPVYAYVSASRKDISGGVVGTMANEGDLTDLLNMALEEGNGNKELEETDGVKYVIAKGAAFAYCADWFFVGPTKDIEETIAELKERADGKGNISGNDAFQKMTQKDGLVQMLFLGEGVESVLSEREMKELKKALPDDVELKDIATLADLVLGDGELLFTAEVLPLSDGMEDYIAKSDKMAKTIDKEQAEYVSGHAFNVFLNFDAEELFEAMVPTLKEMMGSDALAQVEEIAKTLDGTAAIEVYGIDDEGQPAVYAYVGTENNELLQTLLPNLGDSLVAFGDNQYLIPIMKYDWFSEQYEQVSTAATGFQNGQTYYAANPEFVMEAPDDPFPAKELKGKGIYMRFNFGCISDYAGQVGEEQAELIERITDVYDYAELYYEGDGKSVLRITTKSKKTNPVEALFKLLQEYI